MNITLVAGLWTDSTHDGLDTMAETLTALNHKCEVFDWDSKSIPTNSDIYIGHSFGCSAIRGIIASDRGLLVQYWALIDPVDYFWRNNFTLQGQILKADCFQRKYPWFPPSRLILNPSPNPPGFYKNYINIPASHHDMPSNPIVVQTVWNSIKGLK